MGARCVCYAARLISSPGVPWFYTSQLGACFGFGLFLWPALLVNQGGSAFPCTIWELLKDYGRPGDEEEEEEKRPVRGT